MHFLLLEHLIRRRVDLKRLVMEGTQKVNAYCLSVVLRPIREYFAHWGHHHCLIRAVKILVYMLTTYTAFEYEGIFIVPHLL